MKNLFFSLIAANNFGHNFFFSISSKFINNISYNLLFIHIFVIILSSSDDNKIFCLCYEIAFSLRVITTDILYVLNLLFLLYILFFLIDQYKCKLA